MDKQQQNIDGLFRSKLERHEVKPSGLAWERLDKKLSEQEKPAYPWWRVAAAVLLLLTAGGLLWNGILMTEELPMPLAQEQVLPEEVTEVAPETIEEIVEETIPAAKEIFEPQKTTPVAKAPAQPAKVQQQQQQQQQQEEEIRQTIAVIEIEPISIPDIEVSLPEPQEVYMAEASDVKVRIVSSGIIDQPEKETIIDEIETKIEKVGSLFNKVDQGFADLQDAKNNLFATITSRKNKN